LYVITTLNDVPVLRIWRRSNYNLTFFNREDFRMANKESLIVASKVKAYIKSKKMMTSSDALGAISDKVYSMLDDAIARTKANRRSTVKTQDL
jgi:hypothetical protein